MKKDTKKILKIDIRIIKRKDDTGKGI